MRCSTRQSHIYPDTSENSFFFTLSFMRPLMAGLSFSPPSARSLSSYLLVFFLCLSSSVLVTSKPLDSTVLDELFGLSEEVRPLGQTNGSEGSAEAVTSLLRDQRDVSKEGDPLHAMERGAEPGHVWPRLLLDIMGHQNRFRGRTKKNMAQGCMGNELDPNAAGEGGRC